MSVIKEEYLDINDGISMEQFSEDAQSNHSDEDCDNKSTDGQRLRQLLQKFDMEFLFHILKDSDITYRSLRYLSVDDINSAIRSVGHRAEFREKLFAWRRELYKTNDITIEESKQTNGLHFESVTMPMSTINRRKAAVAALNTINTTTVAASATQLVATPVAMKRPHVADVLQDTTLVTPPPKVVTPNIRAPQMAQTLTLSPMAQTQTPLVPVGTAMNLNIILDRSNFGPVMRKFYTTHGYLQRKHRDELIKVIIDYLMVNDIKLHCSDFMPLVNEIVSIFPSEADAKDYYFIQRNGKRNPMGRLYSKYNNTTKRRRMHNAVDVLSNSSGDASACAPPDQELDDEPMAEVPALDTPSLNAIKSFLRCDGIDWEDVCTMWAKTYHSRQQDLTRFDKEEFFQSQWPKYLMSRGVELFDIDFKWKYPRKSDLLFRKWTAFKSKIFSYYEHNINNEMCKSLFAICRSQPGKEVEDYLLTTLLNAILPPSARFKDSSGTNKRKASIADAIEWFVIRVATLEELPQRQQEITSKYNIVDADSTPTIVVVGESNYDLTAFYVSFMQTLYQLPDFLSAVDTCLKIFRVLALPYPPTTVTAWTFIQRYFYEINLPNDVKSPWLISLFTHLTHT